MWLSILAIAFRFLGLASWFENWLANYHKEKEIAEDIEAYKHELDIKNRPAGSDSDVIDRL
jgi:hypothetical protein